MTRTLRLRRESLAELGAGDLGNVAGAAPVPTLLYCVLSLVCYPRVTRDCVDPPTVPPNYYTVPC